MRKVSFSVDLESFQLIRDEVGVGTIKELSKADAAALAEHIEGHPDTVYVASSGVNLSEEFGIFDAGQSQVAIEWIRQENKPQPGEPECNTYRYIFGLTKDSLCVGIDVTKKPETGQVAEHWTTFDNALNRHFPDIHGK